MTYKELLKDYKMVLGWVYWNTFSDKEVQNKIKIKLEEINKIKIENDIKIQGS